MTVIVSDYSSFYERIYTVDALCVFTLKLSYHFKPGYRVWAMPTMWMARLWYKLTGKGIYRGTNIRFERHVPGTDQITWHSPWDDCR